MTRTEVIQSPSFLSFFNLPNNVKVSIANQWIDQGFTPWPPSGIQNWKCFSIDLSTSTGFSLSSNTILLGATINGADTGTFSGIIQSTFFLELV